MPSSEAEVWDRIYSTQEWGRYPAEDLVRFMAKHFYQAPDRSSVRVLELGCGPGANIWYLAREGFSALGMDTCPVAVERARKRLADDQVHGISGVARADVARMPKSLEGWGDLDGSFDAVVDIECMSCNSFETAQMILQEVLRVLKPGGLFYWRSFSNVTDPTLLADRGYIRYEMACGITKLLRPLPFELLRADKMERSVGGCGLPASWISEWCITARKPL